MADNEQINKAYYAVIPATIRYDTEVPPNAKLLYGEITALCNQKGYCWATNDYFATLYNCSKQSISRWIGLLKNRGYISVEIVYKAGSKEIEYRYIRILEYPIQKNEDTPPLKNAKENTTSSFNITNNNTSNKKESKKVVKNNSFDEIIDRYLYPDGKSARFPDTGERRELLQEWLKVRKAKRAAMTDRAIEININKLEDMARKSRMSVVKYLEEVICRGWAAFFVINDYSVNTRKGDTQVNRKGSNVFLDLLDDEM